MKIVIVLIIFCILLALGSALSQLIRRNGSPERMVRALSIRVGLSVFLFLLLLVAFKLGYIHPHGVNNWKS